MKMARIALITLGVLVLNLACTTYAYASAGLTTQPNTSVVAYIDPTAGGVIIQMLLTGAAGAIAIAGIFWKRIWLRFERHKGTEQTPGADAEDNVTEKD